MEIIKVAMLEAISYKTLLPYLEYKSSQVTRPPGMQDKCVIII